MILLARELTQAGGLLDVHDLKGTLPGFQAAVTVLVQKYGKASMALASKFYLQQRRSAGIPGSFRVAMANPATHDAVKSALDDALSGLWDIAPTHPVSAFTASTVTDEQRIQDLLGTAQVQVQGWAEKLAQDPARQTVIDTATKDPKATGWARIPEPAASPSGTCAFCIMLATRGAVYKTERHAAFEAHPGCKCHPEPIFTGQLYVPSAQVMDWQQTYGEATKGRSGADARAAFRQAIEGRPVTGLAGKPAATITR